MSFQSSNCAELLKPFSNENCTDSKDSGCELNLLETCTTKVEETESNVSQITEMKLPSEKSKFINSVISIFYHTPIYRRPRKRKRKKAKQENLYKEQDDCKAVFSQAIFEEIVQNLCTSGKIEEQNSTGDVLNQENVFDKSQEDVSPVSNCKSSEIERTTAGGLPCKVCASMRKVCSCAPATSNIICPEAINPKDSEIFPKAAAPNYGPQIPLDDTYWQQIAKNCIKLKHKLPIDLGQPVGLITSNVLIKEHGEQTQNVRFATYLKAMALIYIQDVSLWQSYDLDTLMQEGKDLAMTPTENAVNVAQSAIYSSIELSVPSTFHFLEHQFHIELDYFDTWIWELKDNLHAALKKFFREKRFCLIQFMHLYLLIWKKKSKYFLLDFNGRDADSLATHSEQGLTAMLLCVKQLRNVVHFICNMSDLDAGEAFLIREMIYTEVISPEGHTFSHEISRQHEYKIINENYAYLASKLHLTLNPAVPVRNRSALPVALATMLATKIDHPATWNTKMLDHLICYGVDLCRRCWATTCLNYLEPLNLEDFPHCMHIGQFLVSYELKPQVYTGKWKCRPLLKHHDFRFVLKRALVKHNYLIFQINNQMYALWQKHSFYYLLDPYLHYIWGATAGEESELAKQKQASVRMLRNIDTFINIFHHTLLQSNRCSTFYIHTLKINSIIESWNCAQPVEVSIVSEDFPSLNEYICFKEHYPTCLDELGQTSDYEENIVSVVSSISSVETSLTMVEEEEGGEDIVEAEVLDSEKDTSELALTMAVSRRSGEAIGQGANKRDQGANKRGQGANKRGQGANKRGQGPNKRGQGANKRGQGANKRGQGANKRGQGANKRGQGANKSQRKSKVESSKGNKNKRDNIGTAEKNAAEQAKLLEEKKKAQETRKLEKSLSNLFSQKDGKTAEQSKNEPVKDIDKSKEDSRLKNLEKSESKDIKSKKTIKKVQSTEESKTKVVQNNEEEKSALISVFITEKEKLNKTLEEEESEKLGRKNVNEDITKAEMFKKEVTNEEKPDRFSTDINTTRTNINKKIKQVSIDDDSRIGETYKVMPHRDSKLVAKLRQRTSKTLRVIYNPQRKILPPMFPSIVVPEKKSTGKDSHYEAYFRSKPCYAAKPKNLIIANSKTGTYASICNILRASIRCADRIMIATPMGNFVIFRGPAHMSHLFFLYQGCTCHLHRFRYWDLSCGSAGLIPFNSIHDMIRYMTEQPFQTCTISATTKETNGRICKACLQSNWCM